ncbi:MAG: prepilin-type N-terminal cleavage/methylation domain-containing protein [Roseibacillus sp.]|nr:prepilin-type N-terminal cleavage/methylation domain-containing protein [Roseibacillus sp.]
MTISLLPKRPRRGFTLAELMVAMAITVILLTLLVSVTAVALDGWRVSRNKVRAARQAKASLDQMSRDFEAMVLRTGTNFEWLYTETDPDAPGPNDNESPNAARILMFSAVTDRYDGEVEGPADKGGDVTGLSYKLLYKDPITADYGDKFSVFALYRQLVDPDETFEVLLEHDPVNPKDLDTKFQRYKDDLGDSSNFVCENIFELTVVFTVEYTELVAQRLVTRIERIPIIETGGEDAAEAFSFTGNGIKVNDAENVPFKRGRISAVDLSITVLTDKGIAQLRKGNNFSGSALESFLSKNSYQYSKTILLPQP